MLKQTIIRRLDFQNRITLPKQFISAMHLEPEDELVIALQGNSLTINSLKNYCVFCGKEASTLFHNKPVCKECVAKLSNN